MWVLYRLLRRLDRLLLFQSIKVALWGTLVKLASVLSAFSIYKQTFGRFVPSAHIIEWARSSFEKYIHPFPEFLLSSVGVRPTIALNDVLALYILFGGLVVRYVKALSGGFYLHLMHRERLSVSDTPFPGQQGIPEQPDPVPLTLFDRTFLAVMRMCWRLAEFIVRKKVTLGRGDLGNIIMNTSFALFVLPVWPAALIYLLVATRRPFALQHFSVPAPHPKWETELLSRRIGMDADKSVAYVSIEMEPHRVLIVQLCFVALLVALIIVLNVSALIIMGRQSYAAA